MTYFLFCRRCMWDAMERVVNGFRIPANYDRTPQLSCGWCHGVGYEKASKAAIARWIAKDPYRGGLT